MESYTWTVKFTWDYDPELIAYYALDLIEQYPYLYGHDHKSAIYDVITDFLTDPEVDERLIENFDIADYDHITKRVMEKMKKDK